jgi:serine/threonine protein kinase
LRPLTLSEAAFSPGYVAPDVERFFKNNDADRIPVRDTRPGVTLADIPRRITTATNIWNAALIMADLISPQRFIKPDWTRQAYSARDTWLDNFINQKDTDPRMQGYSKLLKDTVIQCLSYMPGQRPTPTDLLARVDHGVNQYSGVMQTRDCFNTTKYSGQYDLNPSVPFSDDYPVTQPEDWEMADDEDDDEDDDDDEGFTPIKRPGGGGPTPKTPHVEAPDKARRSKTTTAGAPQDTPLKGFVVGPDAGEATRHFWDPDPDYERVEPSESRHDYVDDSLLRQAFEGDMPNEPIG